MRLTYYIAASVAAAGGVVIDAFNRRPNFYSATVYLAQTPLCFMILANFIFVCYSSIIYALQRLLFGDLRIIERERLWERGWISVTETLLIMMTFRDDVGGWFLFILANLVVARMWAWLVEGRIEMLEQQPPSNPRLFHTRLTASLLICCLGNFGFLKYCVHTVLEQARPGMMVMFAFEFAVLTITSFSNLFRYCIALWEIRVVVKQTRAKIEVRRAELRAEREAAQARITEDAEASAEATSAVARLTREEQNIDENDIDVPGWEDKGRWVFGLDILTDFLRLVVYLAFFSVLMIFHGIPIHIVRDVYITLHSFLKRIYSFWQYRTATKDMNTRFPDATAEELGTDSTCIVCREDMRPWPAEGQPPMEQRLRAKKLPCGHILHFGCLRSWLERQQVCPTCRRPVLDAPGTAAAGAGARRAQPPALPGIPRAPGAQAPAGQPQGGHQQQPPNAPGGGQAPPPNPLAQWRPRTFNLGPLRVAFGNMPAGAWNQLQQLQNGQLPAGSGATAAQPMPPVMANPLAHVNAGSPAAVELELLQIERELSRQIMELNVQQQQLGLVRMLQTELVRLRAMHAQAQVMYSAAVGPGLGVPIPATATEAGPSTAAPTLDTAAQGQLPTGLTLPEGWTLVPLTRTEAPAQPETSIATPNAVASLSAAAGPPSTSSSGPTLQPTPVIPLPGHSEADRRSSSAPSSTLAPSGHDANGRSDVMATAQSRYALGQASEEPVQPVQTTTNGLPHAPAPVAAASVPTWSFDAAPTNDAVDRMASESERLVEDTNVNGHASETRPVENAANGTVDKGKGRAVTIEDEPEID